MKIQIYKKGGYVDIITKLIMDEIATEENAMLKIA